MCMQTNAHLDSEKAGQLFLITHEKNPDICSIISKLVAEEDTERELILLPRVETRKEIGSEWRGASAEYPK